MKYNDNPQNCMFSTFTLVCNPDGRIAGENHRLFQTISYDFFTIDNKKYPNVKTKDGLGNEIKMDFPNGMISWMKHVHSDYRVDDEFDIRDASPADLFFVPLRNYVFKIGNFYQKLLLFV